MSKVILSILEALRKTAAIGKYYTNNEYDQIRYTQMLTLAETLYKHVLELDIITIDPIETLGYITPKIGVNGIIENSDGEILLEQRSDDKSWGLPGGWAEVGLSAEENVKKELLEETGLTIEIDSLVGIMSRKPSIHYPFTSYHVLYKCFIVFGTPKISHESLSLGWHSYEQVTNWHLDHKEWVQYYMQQSHK